MKKTGNKKFIQYDNLNRKDSVYIKHEKFTSYHDKIDQWIVFSFKGKGNIPHFKKKSTAVKSAHSYMKKHDKC